LRIERRSGRRKKWKEEKKEGSKEMTIQNNFKKKKITSKFSNIE